MYDNSERDPRLNVPEILDHRYHIIQNATERIKALLGISEAMSNVQIIDEHIPTNVVSFAEQKAKREQRQGGKVLDTAILDSEQEVAREAVDAAFRTEQVQEVSSDVIYMEKWRQSQRERMMAQGGKISGNDYVQKAV